MIERAGSPSPGAPSSASASRVATGPTPQFTPIASTPAEVSAATAAAGRRAVGEHEVVAERHRGDDRHVARGPRLGHGEEQVVEVEERLDDEDVGAALEEAVDLLPERGPDRGVVRVAELARRRTQRADRPADPRVAAADVAGLARDLGRAAVEAAGLRGQPVGVEPEPVGAERQRLDEVRARVEVLAVERRHQVRSGSWPARRGRHAAGCRARTGACPCRRPRAAARAARRVAKRSLGRLTSASLAGSRGRRPPISPAGDRA